MKIDMSAQAVTTRLKRVAQLRRLGLSLQQAKIQEDSRKEKVDNQRESTGSRDDKTKNA